MYNVSKKSEHLSIASNQTCKNEKKKTRYITRETKFIEKWHRITV